MTFDFIFSKRHLSRPAVRKSFSTYCLKPTNTLLSSREVLNLTKLKPSFLNPTFSPKSGKVSKSNLLSFLRLHLASPENIQSWAERTLPNGQVVGEVTNAKTVDFLTLNPEQGGLFCEQIFGPVHNFKCSCEQNKLTPENPVCLVCGVEFISSQSRRYKMGFIKLISPATHIWYFKAAPRSLISVLLDSKKKDLEAVRFSSKHLTFNTKSFQKNLVFRNLWPLLKAPFLTASLPKKRFEFFYHSQWGAFSGFSEQLMTSGIPVFRTAYLGTFPFFLVSRQLRNEKPSSQTQWLSKLLNSLQSQNFSKKVNRTFKTSYSPSKTKVFLDNPSVTSKLAPTVLEDFYKQKFPHIGSFPNSKNDFSLQQTSYSPFSFLNFKAFGFFKPRRGIGRFSVTNCFFEFFNANSPVIVSLFDYQLSLKSVNVQTSYSHLNGKTYGDQKRKPSDFLKKKDDFSEANLKGNPWFFKSQSHFPFVFTEVSKKGSLSFWTTSGSKKRNLNQNLKLGFPFGLSTKTVRVLKKPNQTRTFEKQKKKIYQAQKGSPSFKQTLQVFKTDFLKTKKVPCNPVGTFNYRFWCSRKMVSSFQRSFMISVCKTLKKQSPLLKTPFFVILLNHQVRIQFAFQPLRTLKRPLWCLPSPKKKVWNSKNVYEFSQQLKTHLVLTQPPLLNNYYTLSQDSEWTTVEDLDVFRTYWSPKAKSTDRLVPAYLERGVVFDVDTTGGSALKLLLGTLTPVNSKNPPLPLLSQSLLATLEKTNQDIDNLEQSLELVAQNSKAFGFKNQALKTTKNGNRTFETSYSPKTLLAHDHGFTQFNLAYQIQSTFQKWSALLALRSKLLRRLKMIRGFIHSKVLPEWMVLSVLPVLPPTLRPILSLESDQVAIADLNKFYQTILFRNQRLKRFYLDYESVKKPSEKRYAQQVLQEAVDALIENGKGSPMITTPNQRPLKSLSDLLKGKKGRFRQNLLGKRVDYSGRSVIVVGPQLKLHECGLPKEMAFELFQPFLIRRMLSKKLAVSFTGAKKLLQLSPDSFLSVLNEVMQDHPVFLNRAPTLHRLGIQAFQPKLILGRTILLHPLVCNAFNADFDGDQMAVHIPLSKKACSEAWKFMGSRNQLVSPATGEPMLLPSQDMVLGCYYLTTHDSLQRQRQLRQSPWLVCLEKSEKTAAFQTVLTKVILDRNGFPILKRQTHRPSFLSISKAYSNYFTESDPVLLALNQNWVHFHDPIWLRWNAYFESSLVRESSLELRLDKHGNSLSITPTTQTSWNFQKKLVVRYLKTTAGRVLMNQVISDSHFPTRKVESLLTQNKFSNQ